MTMWSSEKQSERSDEDQCSRRYERGDLTTNSEEIYAISVALCVTIGVWAITMDD